MFYRCRFVRFYAAPESSQTSSKRERTLAPPTTTSVKRLSAPPSSPLSLTKVNSSTMRPYRSRAGA